MGLSPEVVQRLLQQGMPAEKLAAYLNPDGTVRGHTGSPATAGKPAARSRSSARPGRVAERILAVAGEHPDWHAQQIADRIGTDYWYVVQTVNKHGAPIARKPVRSPKTAFADEAAVIAVYAELQSLSRTARRLGVSYSTVRNRLIGAGVQRRPAGRGDHTQDPYSRPQWVAVHAGRRAFGPDSTC